MVIILTFTDYLPVDMQELPKKYLHILRGAACNRTLPYARGTSFRLRTQGWVLAGHCKHCMQLALSVTLQNMHSKCCRPEPSRRHEVDRAHFNHAIMVDHDRVHQRAAQGHAGEDCR